MKNLFHLYFSAYIPFRLPAYPIPPTAKEDAMITDSLSDGRLVLASI